MKTIVALALTACLLGLIRLDRYFLKQNDGFCIHHILTNWEERPEESIPFPKEIALPLLDQKFHYLGKGHQSYVFASENGQTVLKFYRFPSHLRPFPWLRHPFSYRWSAKRKQIKAYNLQKFSDTLQSYRIAFEELKEDCGLIAVHLAPTHDLHAAATIVDRLGRQYTVDLDQVVFLLQRKAEMIFPLLEKQNGAGREKMIHEISKLIQRRCQKGITDQDAILEKNYGWLDHQAIHIDLGRFKKIENPSAEEEIKRITASLINS